jgi:hypothetical protein
MLLSRLCVVAALLLSSPAWAKIEGLYGSDCLQVDGLSAVKDFLFENSRFEMVQTVFGDTACDGAVYDFSFSGPYVFDQVSSGLDLTFSNVRLTALDSRIVHAFNAVALCGITDWELEIPVEVSGLACGGQTIPGRDSRIYDIIREVEGGVQMGLPEDLRNGSSPGKRPEAFDDLIYKAK